VTDRSAPSKVTALGALWRDRSFRAALAASLAVLNRGGGETRGASGPGRLRSHCGSPSWWPRPSGPGLEALVAQARSALVPAPVGLRALIYLITFVTAGRSSGSRSRPQPRTSTNVLLRYPRQTEFLANNLQPLRDGISRRGAEKVARTSRRRRRSRSSRTADRRRRGRRPPTASRRSAWGVALSPVRPARSRSPWC